MRTFPWRTEDGWPYADSDNDVIDPASELDEDLLNLTVPPRHLLDDLEPLERTVLGARYGLAGQQLRSMKELQAVTGLPRSELRAAIGSGLAKLRARLS